MFLKLYDEHGVLKMVNVSQAQSIEKFVDEDQTVDVLKEGIRIIWNESIVQDNTTHEFYSEQIFFGITYKALESLMIQNFLLILPGKKINTNGSVTNSSSETPAAEKEAVDEIKKEVIPELIKEETPVIEQTPVIEEAVSEVKKPDPKPNTPAKKKTPRKKSK